MYISVQNSYKILEYYFSGTYVPTSFLSETGFLTDLELTKQARLVGEALGPSAPWHWDNKRATVPRFLKEVLHIELGSSC